MMQRHLVSNLSPLANKWALLARIFSCSRTRCERRTWVPAHPRKPSFHHPPPGLYTSVTGTVIRRSSPFSPRAVFFVRPFEGADIRGAAQRHFLGQAVSAAAAVPDSDAAAAEDVVPTANANRSLESILQYIEGTTTLSLQAKREPATRANPMCCIAR